MKTLISKISFTSSEKAENTDLLFFVLGFENIFQENVF